MATTTKDAAHTPGPWRLAKMSGSNMTVRASDGDRWIATCHGSHVRTPAAEWRANYHLIAAAPDLLKAAKHAIKRLEVVRADMTEADERAVEMCRAAIAKAKGGD